MNRALISAAGLTALYLALVAVSLGPLFATGGHSGVTFGIAMVVAITLIPVTAILFTMIRRLRLWNPPARRRTVASLRETGREAKAVQAAAKVDARTPFEFAFAVWNGIDFGPGSGAALGASHRAQHRTSL